MRLGSTAKDLKTMTITDSSLAPPVFGQWVQGLAGRLGALRKNESHGRVFALLFAGLVVGSGLLWQVAADLDLMVRSEELEAVTQTENDSLVRHVERGLHAFRGELFIVARHPATQRLYDGSTSDERDEAAEIFRLMAEEIPTITQVRYLNARGDEIVRVDRRSGEVIRVSDLALQNKADRYYFTDTMALEPGDLYVSPLDLNVDNGVIEEPWVPTIRMATPVAAADGTPAGIVILNFNAGPILDAFDMGNEEGQRHHMLLNRDGYWLAGVPTDQLFGNMFPDGRTLAAENPELWQTVEQSEPGVVSRDGAIYAYETVAPHPREMVSDWTPHHLVTDSALVVLTGHTVLHRIGPLAPGSGTIAVAGVLVLGLVAWIWSGTIVSRRRAVEAEEQARSQLIRSEKMASLGSLVAGIAHELRNPLANIYSLTKLAQRAVPEGEEQLTDDLNNIRGEAERASDIIQGLLDFSRQGPTRQSEFSLADWLQECVQLVMRMAEQREISLELAEVADIRLHGDQGLLQQAVVNVLINALQASPPRSVVRVSTEMGAVFVQIAIQDKGAGIPAGILDRLFDPFFTTKPEGEGTGLGLSIALGIVEKHQGRLVLENGPDGGTVARILLPLQPTHEGASASP